MFITIEVPDLDRLAHALLIAKADYTCDGIARCNEPDSEISWDHIKRNIEALDALYAQLLAAEQPHLLPVLEVEAESL